MLFVFTHVASADQLANLQKLVQEKNQNLEQIKESKKGKKGAEKDAIEAQEKKVKEELKTAKNNLRAEEERRKEEVELAEREQEQRESELKKSGKTGIPRMEKSDRNCDPEGIQKVGQLEFGEPNFCDYHTLINEYEIKDRDGDLKAMKNVRAFKFGDKIFVGYAVGQTANSVGELAATLPQRLTGNSSINWKNYNYCTMHYNNHSSFAKNNFGQCALPKPNSKGDVEEILSLITTGAHDDKSCNAGFDKWTECLEETKFLALGCHGQQHRGPTAVAMFFAAAGCTPKHSEYITCKIWGRNGVLPAGREETSVKIAQFVKTTNAPGRTESRQSVLQKALGVLPSEDSGRGSPRAGSSNQ